MSYAVGLTRKLLNISKRLTMKALSVLGVEKVSSVMNNEKCVLLIVGSLAAGGAERVTIGLFEYLLSEGWDAYLFVAHWGNEKERVYSLKAHEDRLLHVGTHNNGFMRSIANLSRLKSALRRYRPSWVISLGASYNLMEAAGCFSVCNTITSERNWPPSYYPSERELNSVERVYEKSSIVVFQTVEAAVCFNQAISEKGVVIPNPVLSSLPKWNGADSEEIIYFGRLDPQKRPDIAIDSFKLFHDEHPEFKMSFYGVGEALGETKRRAEQYGLSDCVRFYPSSSHIHQIAARCRLYLNTSDFEGISNSMLEALTIGLPCVCTDCAGGGARLAIDDGIGGLLVPCGNPKAVAEAMCRIVESKSLSESMSHAAARRMKSFEANHIFSKWEELMCLPESSHTGGFR